MMQDEKDRILTLLESKSRWCQHAEARDSSGQPVRCDDPTAVAWDLTGAVCVLFGWRRASELFSQLERQFVGRKHVGKRKFGLRDPQICSMVAVQEYNDQADTTYETIRARLESMPVYRPESRSRGSEQVLV
jgi:hypothetical protein